MEYTVQFTWDEEAQVWIAESEDIPGLVLESGSIDALMERVRFAAPELLRLNSAPPAAAVRFQLDRLERLYA